MYFAVKKTNRYQTLNNHHQVVMLRKRFGLAPAELLHNHLHHMHLRLAINSYHSAICAVVIDKLDFHHFDYLVENESYDDHLPTDTLNAKSDKKNEHKMN